MPCTIEKTIAGDVAGLLILGEGVERLALVGPLLGTVVAGDDRVFLSRLVAGFGLQHRPGGRAGAVAGRFSASVLVERVERHALLVGEDVALGAACRLD